MKNMGGREYQLWDETDGFFYDVCAIPNGTFHKFRVRSLVGLIPLYRDRGLERTWIEPFRSFSASLEWFIQQPAGPGGEACFTEWHDGRITLRAVDRRSDTARDAAAAHVGPETNSFPRTASAACRSSTSSTVPVRRQRGALRAGRSRRQDQGRQFELARAGLVSDIVPADRIAAQSRAGIRARLHGEAPGRHDSRSRQARWRRRSRTA